MAKAELERAYERYEELIRQARQHEAIADYGHAVEEALEAWHYAEDMMKYARKYQDRAFSSVSCADIVFRLAPLVFHIEALDSAATLLRQYRGVDRNASDDLAERQQSAVGQLRLAHTLWCHIETNPGCRQDELRSVLGGSQEVWRAMCEQWEKMRLLRRIPSGGSYRLEAATDFSRTIDAKCVRCGDITRGRRVTFLTPQHCSSCQMTASFVALEALRPDTHGETEC